MALMVLDELVERQLKAQREASPLYRCDEVWDGMYVAMPLADNEQRDLQTRLTTVIHNAVGFGGSARVCAANVSDREDGWLFNYRIPDLVVVFPGGAARDCDTHWCGGPDLIVEIPSRGDRSRDKLDFYAAIGVRELLLVDRWPWALELYRLDAGRLVLAGRSDVSTGARLPSEVLRLSFKLTDATPRPVIDVTHRDGVQHWTV